MSCRPMINRPPPFMGLTIRIPIIILIKGRGLINQESGIGHKTGSEQAYPTKHKTCAQTLEPTHQIPCPPRIFLVIYRRTQPEKDRGMPRSVFVPALCKPSLPPQTSKTERTKAPYNAARMNLSQSGPTIALCCG